MATFIINTRSELYKSRRTAAFWIMVAGSAFIPVISMIMYLARPDKMVRALGDNHWITHITNNWQPMAAFFLPVFVIMLCSLVVQIEYRNNTWKQVYALPRSYADIFFSKFIVIQLLIIGCLVLFNIFLILTGYFSNIIHSEYKFNTTALPLDYMMRITGRLYLAVMAMTAIQYWMSLRIKNYIAPMGIGLALLITGMIIMPWEKIIYYPYAYSAVTFFKKLSSNSISDHEYYSMIWFAVVLGLAFFDSIRRRERG